MYLVVTERGRYAMDKDFSVDNLKQIVRSGPVPEEQENLKVAVAKNFRELVTDSDVDVMIEFYAS